MKNAFAILCLLLSNHVLAKDMSTNESYETAYKQLSNGAHEYVGKCSAHEDFKNHFFQVTETLVHNFKPNFDDNEANVLKKLSSLDKELITKAKKYLDIDSMANIDDITVEKISSSTIDGLNLFRLNVGIGGGNGMFLVFNKSVNGSLVTYKLMSQIMDGDVEFCDEKVWLN